MDSFNVVTALKSALQTRTWDGTGALVFGTQGVVVSYATDPVFVKFLGLPGAVIIVGDDQSDPDHGEEPGLYHQRITVRVFVSAPNDATGEAAIMGAGYSAGSSVGRGILELRRQVHGAVGQLTKGTGVNIKNVTSGGGQGAYIDEEKRYLGYGDVHMTAVCTDTQE